VRVNADRVFYREAEDRDRWAYGVGGTYSRRLSSRLSWNVSPSYRRTDFDEVSENGEDRDSQSFRLSVGGDYTTVGGINVGVSVAGVYFTFADPDRSDRQNVDVSADVGGAVRLGPATRLALQLERSTNATTAEDFSVRTQTAASAGLTHVFGPSWSAGLDLGVARDEFDDGSRVDHRVEAIARLSYAITDRLVGTGSYRFEQRFADEDENDFRRNLFTVGLTVSF
jgi:long-subunit fatty acid transport protein